MINTLITDIVLDLIHKSFYFPDGTELGKNLITFCEDIRSFLHITNKNKNILNLGKIQADDLYVILSLIQIKNIPINFTEQRNNFFKFTF